MNRHEQLKNAIESCLACNIPSDTQFVIVDNASTDDTENTVHVLFKQRKFQYIYKKMPKNIGAGAGRNIYYGLSVGDYVYAMDDDAEIDYQNDPDFFNKGIEIMDMYPEIAALATQIYDEAWKDNRQVVNGPQIHEGIYLCKMFCGGSHFLRRNFYNVDPYYPNKYGYEELPPSLMAFDAGMVTAFVPALTVIHKPKVNKWDKSSSDSEEFLLRECATQYAVKKNMYPRCVVPICYLAYIKRIRKHLRRIPNAKKRCNTIVKENSNCKSYNRVKLRTIIILYKMFGISIF